MKASELRIGNWVNDTASQSFQITASDIVVMSQCESIGKIHPGYNPTPIIEAWVLKAGFKPKPAHPSLYEKHIGKGNLTKITIHKYKDDTWAVGIADYSGVKENQTIIKILSYVHELHNFLFALTDQEPL